MPRIGIVGTRTRDTREDYYFVKIAFLNLMNQFSDDEIIIVSGGATRGADRFAEMLAYEHDLWLEEFNPAFKSTRKEQLKEYFRRNKEIADNCDYLIACVSKDRKGGTESTIKFFLRTHDEDRLTVV